MGHRQIVTSLILLSAIGCFSDTRNTRSFESSGAPLRSKENDEEKRWPIVTALEGLPRIAGKEFNWKEAKADSHTMNGHLFYNGHVPLSLESQARVQEVLHANDSYTPHTEKLCGGFHPDWAIDIDYGFNKILYLICFGCQEIKTLEGVNVRSEFDLTDEAYETLYHILTPNHVKCPPDSRPKLMTKDPTEADQSETTD